MSELYHHGIKGQRWGVRRFQNKDGSYTAAGKKRYQATNGDITKKYDIKNGGGIYGEAAERFYDEIVQDPYVSTGKELRKMIEKRRNAVSKILENPKYQTSLEKQVIESFKKHTDLNNEYLKTNNLIKAEKFAKARDIEREKWKELSKKALNDEQTQKMIKERFNKIKSITDKYYDKQASAILRHLGYKDDRKSRDFLIYFLISEPDEGYDEYSNTRHFYDY